MYSSVKVLPHLQVLYYIGRKSIDSVAGPSSFPSAGKIPHSGLENPTLSLSTGVFC